MSKLPEDKQARKERPMARGLLDYFPDALAEVAHVSYVGNQQHNPGEEMHWAREKSQDHADCIIRHLIDRKTHDTDGIRHSAKVAWRALALLQIEIEEAEKESQVENSAVRDGLDLVLPQGSLVATATAVSMMPTFWRRQKTPGPVDTAFFVGNLVDRIVESGCEPDIARHIASGFTWSSVWRFDNRRVYIAGPMRKHKDFNFPAFDEARNRALALGWHTISPADIDRAAGDHKITEEEAWGKGTQRRFAYRDFHALHWLQAENGDALALLPGWESSVGATAEFFLARWLGLKILSTDDFKPLNSQSLSYSAIYRSVAKFLVAQSLDTNTDEE